MKTEIPKIAALRQIARKLLVWYDQNARALPWRCQSDPYRIWISEIMLQQTQVITVIPYYERFLQAFPNLSSLAAAPLDSVLKRWEGLGYYSRARNLHKAAQTILTDYQGRLPRTAQELLKIPGIGRYTAGAIASMAFDQPAAVLDGNVIRVLCRLFLIKEDTRRNETRELLWSLAQRLVPQQRPGDYNQALMELGATICTPRRPACEHCPLKGHCQACKQGCQDTLPVKKAAKALPHYTIAAAVIIKRGRVLIDRRPPEKMLGGLWEFPGGKQLPGETIEQTLIREVREELDIRIEPVEPITIVKHAYSHFRITLHAWLCRHVSGRPRPLECDACRWIWLKDLTQYAFPTANIKIIKKLAARS